MPDAGDQRRRPVGGDGEDPDDRAEGCVHGDSLPSRNSRQCSTTLVRKGDRMRLSRDDILKAEDTAPEEVPVPEWGGTVLVRGMTGKERDQFEVSLPQEAAGSVQVQRGRAGGRPPGRNLVNMRAKIVARCVVTDDGGRTVSHADVAALWEKSGAPIDWIFTVAARLSGMGEEDAEKMAAKFGEADSAPS